MKTNIFILGSTGSIGSQTLDVIRANQDKFNVIGLSADRNIRKLLDQIKEFKPKYAFLSDLKINNELATIELPQTMVVLEEKPFKFCINDPDVETVVNAITGFSALEPLLYAIEMNKNIALANKESIVAGWFLVEQYLKRSKSKIVPVDSEHNSIFQCLRSRPTEIPKRVIITASGGPFYSKSISELTDITPEQAIKHPNWSMGAKISIDSATLMNKALEVIEASVLFNIPSTNIEVLIHPQSIIHGIVEYRDGTSIAALYHPDMRVPIANALFTLSNLNSTDENTIVNKLELEKLVTLSFSKPNVDRYLALKLCYQALERGYSAHIALNAANEVAVNNFLEQRVSFLDIVKISQMTLEALEIKEVGSLEEIYAIDRWARSYSSEVIKSKFMRL